MSLAGRDLTHRDGDWAGLSVVVVGLGRSGFAAADALAERGAHVVVLSRDADAASEERATVLRMLDVDVRLGPDVFGEPSSDLDLVVTSPGLPPTHPYLVAAQAHGIPVWGEVELAWRFRPRENPAPWLVVTGTNGKTTTTRMLAAMLQAGGLRARAVGNVGVPIIEAMMDPEPYDALAVELSTFQLHWQTSLAPTVSACLNIAPDHLDWHGSYDAYVAAKGRVYNQTKIACVYNVADPVTEQLVADAEVEEGCRAIGFTLGVPALSMVGLVDEVMADRAFTPERRTSALELATLHDLVIDGEPPAPHYVMNALAAAAMARAVDVPPVAIREALRAFRPDAHRIQPVGTVDGVRFVNDSKATNTAAAAASLAAYDSVVWVAGGLLKGQDVDELVAGAAARLRAAVLIGRDREALAEALARHAPAVPVVRVDAPQTEGVEIMDLVVARALDVAEPGDVVLLAPAAASMDQFASYEQRGDRFAEAVQRRGAGTGT